MQTLQRLINLFKVPTWKMAKLDLNPGGLAAASVLLTTSLSSSFSLGLPPIQFTPRKQLHIQSMQNTGQVQVHRALEEEARAPPPRHTQRPLLFSLWPCILMGKRSFLPWPWASGHSNSFEPLC